jgi:hypothetical protein
MRGIRTLKTVADNLRTIDLPSLRRPAVKPDEPKTEELVQWGICVFVYLLIAHMQKVLAGLAQLAEAENFAAAAPVCRHVFEWAALSCYLTDKVNHQFTQHDWNEAWNLLTKVALGSKWIRQHGGKYAGDPPVKIPLEVPAPVHIPEAVEKYDSYQSQNSREAEARDTAIVFFATMLTLTLPACCGTTNTKKTEWSSDLLTQTLAHRRNRFCRS